MSRLMPLLKPSLWSREALAGHQEVGVVVEDFWCSCLETQCPYVTLQLTVSSPLTRKIRIK
jgi:hypothetical protein